MLEMDQSLGAFIDHARQKGMDHATIRMLLLSAGWKEKEIARAMTAQALDVPIPTPPDVGGAREAFLHLVAFAALYTAVIAGVMLLFDYVNVLLPDPAVTQYAGVQADWVRAAIRWEISALVVSFPLLVWLSWAIVREMRATPDKARSPVRRWLTYLTLFFAAIALAADVITLVSTLLEGEMSARIALKVLVVLVVAGGCFAYYFASLRMTPEQHQGTRLHRYAAMAASAAVVVVIVSGIVMTGSPVFARQRKFDVRRVEDIRMIYGEVMNQTVGPDWRNPEVKLALRTPVPASLDGVVQHAMRQRPRTQDPATGAPYGYEVTGASTFRVCADFDTARDEPGDIVWNHPAGRHCFAFDVLNPTR
jgi:hypothetical protein